MLRGGACGAERGDPGNVEVLRTRRPSSGIVSRVRSQRVITHRGRHGRTLGSIQPNSASEPASHGPLLLGDLKDVVEGETVTACNPDRPRRCLASEAGNPRGLCVWHRSGPGLRAISQPAPKFKRHKSGIASGLRRRSVTYLACVQNRCG